MNETALEPFLRATPVIDWQQSQVAAQARALVGRSTEETVRNCFEWVRDRVLHSSDHRRNPVTCSASEVIQHRTGYCYAKSHLLAALLRANQIPAGFCYQRLSVHDNGAPYALHGFNAVHLREHGWVRVDARGNRPGIDARFEPPREWLAFAGAAPGECLFGNVLADPLPVVVEALQQGGDWQTMLARLPDVAPEQFEAFGLKPR
ncbi:MAG TPA: transglutaminase family protein [Solimonas sp.]|nr:transglutaminase family protein [Solimonas sp.]